MKDTFAPKPYVPQIVHFVVRLLMFLLTILSHGQVVDVSYISTWSGYLGFLIILLPHGQLLMFLTFPHGQVI